MSITLSAELQAFIDEQVRSGAFPSPDAAVAEAVRQMKEREEKLAWLRREVRVGIDQLDRGEGRPWDVREPKAKLREKYGPLPEV